MVDLFVRQLLGRAYLQCVIHLCLLVSLFILFILVSGGHLLPCGLAPLRDQWKVRLPGDIEYVHVLERQVFL